MLKRKNIYIFFLAALLGTLVVPRNTTKLHVKANEQIVETFAYNEMVGYCSSISGNDMTPENSANKLVTYGFRHGSVADGVIEKFSDVSPNNLGIYSPNPTAAFFVNWRMATTNGDAGIITFTAHQKLYWSVVREKLGADWLDDINLTIYKGTTALSTKTLSSASTPADFSYEVLLEAGETVYWEILNPNATNRHISMEGGGGDWSSLPSFTVTEYVELGSETLTLASIVTALETSNGAAVKTSNGIARYKVQTGSINGNTLSDPSLTSGAIGGDDAKLTPSGITLKNNATLSIVFEALSDTTIHFNYVDPSIDASKLELRAYQYFTSKAKTKLMYEFKNEETFPFSALSGSFVLANGEKLYIEYKIAAVTETTFKALNEIVVERKVAAHVADYPLYKPNDFSAKDTLTHAEIATETARLKGNAFSARDVDIHLVKGRIKENSISLAPFPHIIYDDGVYLEGNTQQQLLLSKNGEFDGQGFAAVNRFALKTSSTESVVYQVTAKKDTKLDVRHAATTVGWVDEAGLTYFATYQDNGTTHKELTKTYVSKPNNAEDAFAATYHLKAGDTAYYVFGTDVSYQRNLTIAPYFITNPDDYDSSVRNELFAISALEATLYDTVTNIIINNYEPYTYGEVLTIQLAHGTIDDIQNYSDHKGTGDGSYVDALITGTGADNQTQFKRWQMHAGVGGDDAIMVFTAERDAKFTLTHQAITTFYNSAASIKYYIRDVDKFIEFKEERYLSADTPEDHYGYTAHLRAGQSLIMVYSANDIAGYAVAEMQWIAKLNTTEFDESLVNDFTEARDLQNYKDAKIQAMQDYVASLDESNYTVSNYAEIEMHRDNFIAQVPLLKTKTEINDLYDATIALINGVQTKAQAQAEIDEAINDAILQAETYINEKKALFTKAEWEVVLELFETFKTEVKAMNSKTNIALRLQLFINEFDALPHTAKEKRTLAISLSAGGGAVLVVAALVVVAIKRRKKV